MATFTGTNGNDYWYGREHQSDTYQGLGGTDTVDYTHFHGKITLLPTGLVSKSDGTTDTLSSIETIIANPFAVNNTIDVVTAGSLATIVVNLELKTLTVNNVPGVGTFNVINFDDVFGTNQDDIITGDTQANRLFGNNGNDQINGGFGNDEINGGFGNDILLGGNGNDVLIGGDGLDRLTGGVGNDTLTGGLGGDRFIFLDYGDGIDHITDWTQSSDRITLSRSGFDIDPLQSTADFLAEGFLTYTPTGSNVGVLEFFDDDLATISGNFTLNTTSIALTA